MLNTPWLYVLSLHNSHAIVFTLFVELSSGLKPKVEDIKQILELFMGNTRGPHLSIFESS